MPLRDNRNVTETFGDSMKQIFTDPSVVPCDILKGLLEEPLTTSFDCVRLPEFTWQPEAYPHTPNGSPHGISL